MRFISWLKESVIPNSTTSALVVGPGTYAELNDSSGERQGIILSHTSATRRVLLEHFVEASRSGHCGHDGTISNIILDQFGLASATILASVQAGHLVQIVGTPYLAAGLSNGTLQVMQATGGFTGTVTSQSSKLIVGQLRFSPASLAPIIAPIAVWQVVHAIAGVSQLQDINKRLENLQEKIESLIIRSQARVYGHIAAAIETLQEIDDQYTTIGRFTNDMTDRLVLATRDVRVSLAEQTFNMKRFTDKIDIIKDNNKGASGAVNADSFLQNDAHVFLLDAEMLVMASRASALANKAWIAHDIEHVPEYVPQRIEATIKEISEMADIFEFVAMVEELHDFATNCVNEMNVFTKVLYPNVKKRIEKLGQSQNSQLKDHEPIERSLLVWKEPATEAIRTVAIGIATDINPSCDL